VVCPECGGEYREGFFTCADCEVALVESLPATPGQETAGEAVEVLETGDPAELALAESILAEAGIPFSKRGEHLQNPFALGNFGLGFNTASGPAILLVPEEHAEAAARVLAESMPAGLTDVDLDEPDEAAGPE
jgi:hypothetical protein